MANAEVYVKWSSLTDGDRSKGGWAFKGDGSASGKSGLVDTDDHAERKAWREAWGSDRKDNIRVYANDRPADFATDKLQVKFWVDQQICASCQQWLIVHVMRHLSSLKIPYDLYAEVKFNGHTNRVQVNRGAVWPVTIGMLPTWDKIKSA